MSNSVHTSSQQESPLRQAQLKMLSMLEIVDTICTKHGLDYWLEGGTLLGAIRHQGFIPWDDDLDISMPRSSYKQFIRVCNEELPEHLWLQTAQTDPGYFNFSAVLKIRDLNSRYVELHETGGESYRQGIFIDVFVYDRLPKNEFLRRKNKWLAKKILRLLRAKYTSIPMGHHASVYRVLSTFFSKRQLEHYLQYFITSAHAQASSYLGLGYDCINSTCLHYDDIYPLQRAAFEGKMFHIPNRYETLLTLLYGDYLQLPPAEQRIMKHCRELVVSTKNFENMV